MAAYEEYTYEVTVRVEQNSGKVSATITNNDGEVMERVKGDWEKRRFHASIGNAVCADAWAREYGNDKRVYVETSK